MATIYPNRAPRFHVEIGSQSFREYNSQVSEVIVDTRVDRADCCEIVMAPRFDREHTRFTDIELSALDPGTDVSVAMGYETSTPVFRGHVEAVEPEFPANEPPIITVNAYGNTRQMMRGTPANSWRDTPISTIARAVVSPYFDDIDIQTTDIAPQHVIQDNRSDYRFLNRIATKYGFELFSSVGTVHFRSKFDARYTDESDLTLTYGETLESFSCRKRHAEHSNIEIRYWDREEQQVVSAEDGDLGGPERDTEVFRIHVDSQAEAEQLAKANVHWWRVDGRGTTFGIPSLVAGTHVRVDGVGESTDDYYVLGATHRLDSHGYTTTFEVITRDVP